MHAHFTGTCLLCPPSCCALHLKDHPLFLQLIFSSVKDSVSTKLPRLTKVSYSMSPMIQYTQLPPSVSLSFLFSRLPHWDINLSMLGQCEFLRLRTWSQNTLITVHLVQSIELRGSIKPGLRWP